MATDRDRELARELVIRRLAGSIDSISRRVSGIERSSQMSRRSVHGSLKIVDDNGDVKVVIGDQDDGTTGVSIIDETPPPKPTRPVAVGGIGVIQAQWDGFWEDANGAPKNLGRVQVHVSPFSGFSPLPDTLVGSIENPTGGVLTINAVHYEWNYIVLVAENTSGVLGAPSLEASAKAELVDGPDIKSGAITAGKIRAGTIDASLLTAGLLGQNLLTDPGFEVVDSSWVAATTTGYYSGATPHADEGTITAQTAPRSGRGCGFLTCDRFRGGAVLESAPFKVLSGMTYRHTIHANGSGIPKMFVQVLTATAPEGPWSTAYTSPTLTIAAGWAEYKIDSFTAGPGVAWAKVHYESSTSASSAGQIRLDDLMFTLLGFGAAELTGAGLRLYDADGNVSVDLSSTGSAGNYITIQSDGRPVATVSADGGGSFTYLDADDDMTLGGSPLVGGYPAGDSPSENPPDGILEAFPRGLVAFGTNGPVSTAAGVEKGIVEVAFTAVAGRAYRLTVAETLLVSTGAGYAGVRVRNAGANTPNLNSPSIGFGYTQFTGAGVASVSFSKILRCNISGSTSVGGEVDSGTNRLLIGLYSDVGADTYPTTRWEVSVEDIGLDVPTVGVPRPELNSATNPTGSASTPTVQRTTVWTAVWSGTFDGGTLGYVPERGSDIFQGFAGAAENGNMRGMVGFPSTVASTLTGATIKKLEVYLYFDYWGESTGGTAILGAHGATSRPGTYTSAGLTPVTAQRWPRPAGRWIKLPSTYWAGFKSGSLRGVTLGPGSTTDRVYYGRAVGAGSARPPRLRATYVL